MVKFPDHYADVTWQFKHINAGVDTYHLTQVVCTQLHSHLHITTHDARVRDSVRVSVAARWLLCIICFVDIEQVTRQWQNDFFVYKNFQRPVPKPNKNNPAADVSSCRRSRGSLYLWWRREQLSIR